MGASAVPQSRFEGLTIAVKDLERSIKYYHELLGFEVEVDQGGFRAALHKEGSAKFALFKVGVVWGPRQRATEREASVGFVVPRMPTHLEFQTNDLEGVYSRLRSAGHEITEPAEVPWGGSMCFAKDPDGYTLQFQQHPQEKGTKH